MIDKAPPPTPSLTRRVFGAAAWTTSGYAIALGIRFGTNLVFARLLAPDVFGLLSIATVVMIGLALSSDLGFRDNVVQSQRGSEPAFLNTAWTVQIVRGVILACVALAIAAGLALAKKASLVSSTSVYADPLLPPIIAALSSTALIGGFISTKYFEAGRQLALRRVVGIDLCAQLVGLIVAFLWLWFDRTVWAMVTGNIVATLVLTVLSHTALPGSNNKFHWDAQALHEVMHFGKWIFLSSILTFLATSSDKLILGTLTGAAFLGLYTIAFNLSDLPAQLIARLLMNAAFPALSQVARERAGDLKRAYYKFHTIVAPAAYFLAGLLTIAGPSIIAALYDPRYHSAGWIMQILALSLVAVPFQLSGVCFTAIGKPHLNTAALFARLISLVIAMPLGFRLFDLPGAIAAVVFGQLCALPVIILLSQRLGLLDAKKELIAFAAFPLGLVVGFGLKAALEFIKVFFALLIA